ncbi:hypothetical protein OAB94_02955, partial [Flavobacteriaceae bacterium]|nr:hypothetical protein [Flavobacteriaceae bacterium]
MKGIKSNLFQNDKNLDYTFWSEISSKDRKGGLFSIYIPRQHGCTRTMRKIQTDGFSSDFDVYASYMIQKDCVNWNRDISECEILSSKTVLLIDTQPLEEFAKLIPAIVAVGGYVIRFGQPLHDDKEYNDTLTVKN